jgi:hypothetical protein
MPGLARTTVAIALLLAIQPASAIEIPKQYRGEWCMTKWSTIYQRCKRGDFIILLKGWSMEDNDCQLVSVQKSKYGGHRLQANCEKADDPNPKYRVEERWWLGSNGTRLQMIDKVDRP